MPDNSKATAYPLITCLDASARLGERLALICVYAHYDPSASMSDEMLERLRMRILECTREELGQW